MSRDNNAYDWTFVTSDGDNGHSLWFDFISRRYSIKDQSGDQPHLTDDGVLWFDDSKDAVVHTSKFHKDGLQITFKVKDKYDNVTNVWCKFDFGLEVAEKIGVKVDVSDNLKKIKPLLVTNV